MLYLLDASMLITANKSYYPLDSVPEFWEWLLYTAKEGRVKIPWEIFEEIKDGPNNEETDLLFGWVQKFDVKNALLLAESVNAALVQKAITVGYAPNLTDTEVLRPFYLDRAMAMRFLGLLSKPFKRDTSIR